MRTVFWALFIMCITIVESLIIENCTNLYPGVNHCGFLLKVYFNSWLPSV